MMRTDLITILFFSEAFPAMSQKSTQPVHYQPRSFEMVLDFCVELSRRMIMSGANVERVNLAVDRVCSTYELDDVSIFLLVRLLSPPAASI